MESGQIIYVFISFFLAAFSKGVTGLGFSTLCLSLLSIALEPSISIPLVIIPSLCGNLMMMSGFSSVSLAIRWFWILYISAVPGLIIGVWLLQTVNSNISHAVLGSVITAYAIWAMSNHPLVLRKSLARPLAVPVGFMTGVVNGMTGSQIMPILPYLMSLDLRPEILITSINLSFTISSLFMLLGLSQIGLIQPSLVGIAALGTLFVAIGIFLGKELRTHLSPALYRKLVLLLLSVLGVGLIYESLSPLFDQM